MIVLSGLVQETHHSSQGRLENQPHHLFSALSSALPATSIYERSSSGSLGLDTAQGQDPFSQGDVDSTPTESRTRPETQLAAFSTKGTAIW